MMNIYFEQKEPSFAAAPHFADAICDLGKQFAQKGWTVGSLSYRYARGFVTHGKLKSLGEIRDRDWVWVESWDWEKGTVRYRGEPKPVDEMFLHASVYENRSGAIFVAYLDQMKNSPSGVRVPSMERLTRPMDLKAELERHLGEGNILNFDDTALLVFGCTTDDIAQVLAAGC